MLEQDILRAALSSLAGNLEMGFGSDDGKSAELRLLNLELLEDGNFKSLIASDGLSLEHKILLERKLTSIWTSQKAGPTLQVYFKRVKDVKSSPVKPSASASKPAPFGLKVQKRAIPGVKKVIVVASGKGGVGKSTVSTNLAVSLASTGAKVGFFDGDIYGPSGPTMLGLKGSLHVGADKKITPREAFGLKTVSFGFMSDSQNPVIWRGPMVAKAIEQFCYDVHWGETDYLIVDLPPGTGDVQMSLIENLPIHGAIIVTTPQDIALIDAHKALTMFEKLDVPILGLVENMAGFMCPKCGETSHIFGEYGAKEFSEVRKLPLLISIPLHPALRQGGDSGIPASLKEGSVEQKLFQELARLVKTY
jgi:ATP-binding protein involved in chromosome partitioning